MFTTINDTDVRGNLSINNLNNAYYEIHVISHNLLDEDSTDEEEAEIRAVMVDAIRRNKIHPTITTYIVEFYDAEEGMIQHGIADQFDEAVQIAAALEENDGAFVRIKVVRWYVFK